MNIHFYHCKSCDSFFVKTGAPTEFQCGNDVLKPLEANTSDGAKEKHVPVVSHEGDTLHVQVGSVLHPMLEEHYIQWIALVTEKGYEVHYLNPGDVPATDFADVEHGTVYEYCNLHSLWKTDF